MTQGISLGGLHGLLRAMPATDLPGMFAYPGADENILVLCMRGPGPGMVVALSTSDLASVLTMCKGEFGMSDNTTVIFEDSGTAEALLGVTVNWSVS